MLAFSFRNNTDDILPASVDKQFPALPVNSDIQDRWVLFVTEIFFCRMHCCCCCVHTCIFLLFILLAGTAWAPVYKLSSRNLTFAPDCCSEFGKCACPDFLPVAIEFDCSRSESHFAEGYVPDIVPVLLSGKVLSAQVVEKHADAESVFA